MTTKKPLTEMQQKFLDVLFNEAKGDPVKAKKLAGYSPDYATSNLTNALKDEIVERTKAYIAVNAPRAAVAIVDGIVDPTELGIKEKMVAAKDILDRAGLVKTDKVQVEASGGLMILPAKEKSEE